MPTNTTTNYSPLYWTKKMPPPSPTAPPPILQVPTDPKDLKLFEAAIEENKQRSPGKGVLNSRRYYEFININSGISWGALPGGVGHMNFCGNFLELIRNRGYTNQPLDAKYALDSYFLYCRNFHLDKLIPLHQYSWPGMYGYEIRRSLSYVPENSFTSYKFLYDYVMTFCRWEDFLGPDYSLLAFAAAAFKQIMELPTDASLYMPAPSELLKGTY